MCPREGANRSQGPTVAHCSHMPTQFRMVHIPTAMHNTCMADQGPSHDASMNSHIHRCTGKGGVQLHACETPATREHRQADANNAHAHTSHSHHRYLCAHTVMYVLPYAHTLSMSLHLLAYPLQHLTPYPPSQDAPRHTTLRMPMHPQTRA